MIKNYFKIALRGFGRNKLFTLINILGSSIGISGALVIYLIVHFDFSFDKFHKDGDRIYRVVTEFSFFGQPHYTRGVCGPMPAFVKSEVTGLEAVAPFFTLNQLNVQIPGKDNSSVKFKNQDNIILADRAYFKIFNYQWLAGSAGNALNAPNHVVLTSGQAEKYFPGAAYDQIIGKIVVYDTIKTTVSGVVRTLQENSDLSFHDFISYNTSVANGDLKKLLQLTNWHSTDMESQLFIKLSPATTPASVEKRINIILKRNSQALGKGITQEFRLQKLDDIHFNERYNTFAGGRVANKPTLYGLLFIALFILSLGCINFVNLTIAQATQRAREIGIRKTLGSTRTQLIVQFLSETFLITLIAVIISIVITPLILNLFRDFIPPGIEPGWLGQQGLLLFLLLLTIVVSILSGFYPALILSGFKPVAVLKSQVNSNNGQTRNTVLRKSLTVVQFVIAQFFLMATLLVSKQIHYALNKDMGFDKESVIIIKPPVKSNQLSNKLIIHQLASIPEIELVSNGGEPPSSENGNSTQVTYQDNKRTLATLVEEKFGDENYVKLYKIKILSGRNLAQSDTTTGLLINKTYAQLLGFHNPADAVGNSLFYSSSTGGKKMKIVGVVADFYQSSIHATIKPMVLLTRNQPEYTGTFHVLLKPQTAAGTEWKTAISKMETSWKKIYPADVFEYYFLDESIAGFYETEQRTSTLLRWATGLSIFISCLGLLAFAIHTTNQRTKEIGVRKVLGATVSQIVALLSTELVLLIILAFVIVTPIAWYAMNKWMQTFADRTAISWWIFVASGIGMLLVAMFTSCFQTVKAAIANPVKSLRSE